MQTSFDIKNYVVDVVNIIWSLANICFYNYHTEAYINWSLYIFHSEPLFIAKKIE